MSPVSFEILDRSSRLPELRKTNDLDIIKYTLSRATGLDHNSFRDLKVEYSFIRHRIKFIDKPELLIRILDDLNKLKLTPIIKSNDELIYDIDLFFNKIS